MVVNGAEIEEEEDEGHEDSELFLKSDEALDKENKTLWKITGDLMEKLGKNRSSEIDIKQFRKQVGKDESLMELFMMIVDDVGDLLKYQGENKYTKSVRLISKIKEKFKIVGDLTFNLTQNIANYNLVAKKKEQAPP